MRMNLSAFLCLLTFAGSILTTPTMAEVVTVNPSIPADAVRIKIPLHAAQTNNGAYSAGQIESQPIPDRLIKEAATKPGYTHYFDLGNTPVGNQHVFVLARVNPDITFLSHNQQPVYDVLVMREPIDKKSPPERLADGKVMPGNQVEMPIQLNMAPVGTNRMGEVTGTLMFTINGTSGNSLNGNGGVRSNLSVEGTAPTKSGMLTLTISDPVAGVVEAGKPASLRYEAGGPDQSDTAGSKLGGVFSIGGLKMGIENVSPDFSEATLAVLDGKLENLSVPKPAQVDKLPLLQQTELYSRRVMTRDDLLSQSKASGWLAMVFGEFRPQQMSGGLGMPQSGTIPMAADTLIETLGRDLTQKPATVFVVRQIGTKDLYEDYLGKTPPYLVLTDYVDPTMTQIRANSPFMTFMPNQQSAATLRSAFGIPENGVSVLLFDSTGKTRYSKLNVGQDLQKALLEMNDMMKAEK